MTGESYIPDELLAEGGDIMATLDTVALAAGRINGVFGLDGHICVATGVSRRDGRVLRAWARRVIPLEAWDKEIPVRTADELRAGQTHIRTENVGGMLVDWEGCPCVLGDQIILTPESMRARKAHAPVAPVKTVPAAPVVPVVPVVPVAPIAPVKAVPAVPVAQPPQPVATPLYHLPRRQVSDQGSLF